MSKKEKSGDQQKAGEPKGIESIPLVTPKAEAPKTEGKKEEPKKEEAVKQPPEAAPAPEAAPQAEAVDPAPAIRLDVFCRLTGLKFDKLAGFRYLARREKLGPMSVPKWWAAFHAYQKRPVG